MGIARKYILDCSETLTSGVTTITRINQYDLIKSFSGVSDVDGKIFQYFNVTLEDLADLTDQEYDKRVSDFLIYVGVRTLTERAILLTQASVSDPSCT